MSNKELVVHMLCGLPGSGKTHYVSNCLKSLYPHMPIVSPDDFRTILTGRPFYTQAEDMVWSHAKAMAVALLRQGMSIIIDATNLTKSHRAFWIDVAKQHDAVVDCYLANPPLATVHKRNLERQNIVPCEVIEDMSKRFELPESTNEGIRRLTFIGR